MPLGTGGQNLPRFISMSISTSFRWRLRIPLLRPKPTNELVHSVLPYSGDRTEFPVDMSIEVGLNGHVIHQLIILQYATRFVIFQGAFESVSLAIYGDLVTEPAHLTTHLPPKPAPCRGTHSPNWFPRPANAKDPTLLARQLLELIPESPSLAIVVRLMYCVKPSDADWEHPDFPYLYVDLGQDIADLAWRRRSSSRQSRSLTN
jgi:hypothetical protein